MAAPARRKKRRRAAGKGASESGKRGRTTRAVRRLDEPLTDWRFEPGASRRAIIALVLLSVGGVALGVGVYAQWFRGGELEALAAAPYLMAAGLALVVAYVLVGRGASRVLRVGDLGVGFETGGATVRRTRWYELSAITLQEGTLRLATEGGVIPISLKEHEAGARRVLAEAGKRVPKKLDVHEEDRERLGEPAASEGEQLSVDPPQVTGQRCMSTDEPLTFERDVRMCARCGALYHKAGVPRRCAGCGAKLRG